METVSIPQALTFDDVLLVPQYSEIESRRTVDISIRLGEGIKLLVPLISAPMDTVTELDMAKVMAQSRALGIIHRYNTIEEQQKILRAAIEDNGYYVGAAVGVTGDFLERAAAIKEASPGQAIVCIDIAHGHHILMKKALEALKKDLGDNVHIMAGNVATAKGYKDLSEWGADSVRVGLGAGSVCSTRLATGHGVPNLSAIMECHEARVFSKPFISAKIIADGGIRFAGDVVKSLAAGADAVMCGSLFAGTNEAPGAVIKTRAGPVKVYQGSSSEDAQLKWRGQISSIEGVSTTVPYKGSVIKILEELCIGIRSGLSYSGARNIKELQEKARFVRQTTSGTIESRPHIL